MLALASQRGDIAKRTDIGGGAPFMLQADDPAVLVNWVRLTGDFALSSDLATENSRALAAEAGLVAKGTLGVNVKDYGAKGDWRTVATGSMSASSNVLTAAGGNFTSADVGKYVSVAGAGVSGAAIVSTISGFISSTQAPWWPVLPVRLLRPRLSGRLTTLLQFRLPSTQH
ncbi:MAG TPA: hypothetical protein VF635_07585 [Propionibacteriaceae bacterium]|jgi:hypothetical protein